MDISSLHCGLQLGNTVFEKSCQYVTCVCIQVNLVMTPGALKAIAHLAMERKTGARGLRAIMVGLQLLHSRHRHLVNYFLLQVGSFH